MVQDIGIDMFPDFGERDFLDRFISAECMAESGGKFQCLLLVIIVKINIS